MSAGETKDHMKFVEGKRNARLKAEDNRDRYMREREDEFGREFKRRTEDLEALPDPVGNFYDSQNPSFDERKLSWERRKNNPYSHY